jgi:hypothetical protein
MPEFVMVPVPSDRVMEVYAVLGRDHQSPVQSEPKPDAIGPPSIRERATDPAIIKRAYLESSEKMMAFTEYLAERPGEWVSTEQVGNAIGYTWNQVAGMLGAFGRRWEHRYKEAGNWFFDNKWDHIENHQDYLMPPEAARIIKDLRSGR